MNYPVGGAVIFNENAAVQIDAQGTQVTIAQALADLNINPAECYVLSGKSHDGSVVGVGFYKIYGNTLKAHKAYVIYDGNLNFAPKRMRFVFGQATDVESILPSEISSQKVLENNVLYIIKNGVKYNVQGQIPNFCPQFVANLQFLACKGAYIQKNRSPEGKRIDEREERDLIRTGRSWLVLLQPRRNGCYA